MPRRIPTLLVLLAPATSQQGVVDEATTPLIEALDSGDPPRILRAAFDAGEAGRKSTVPALVRALRDVGKMNHNTGLHARAAILDAIIRLDGKVPAADLESSLRKYLLPAAMVLMAREPKAYEDLLVRVLKNHRDSRTRLCWIAAGEMLVAMRSKKVARELLRDLEVLVDVDLMTPGDKSSLSTSTHTGMGMAGMSHNSFYLRDSPPFGLYELQYNSSAKSLRVTSKIRGMRKLPRGRKMEIRLRSSWMRLQPTKHKFEWIAQLLGTKTTKLPLHPRTARRIFFVDDKTYRKEIERVKQEVRGAQRALATRLRIAGLLGEKEKAPTSIHVRVYVTDQRTGDPNPLPSLTAVTVHPRAKK